LIATKKKLYLLVHFEKKMMELEILGSLQRCHAQSLNEKQLKENNNDVKTPKH
jgi:hypothetical protein